MRRILAISIVLNALAGCATTKTSAASAQSTCFKVNVVITGDDGTNRLVAPGVPVDVIVRSKQGNVLKATKSDADGNASFEVCWRSDDPAWQVEAQLRFGPQFVGTLASFFNYSNTYCLTLPSRILGHCGEWGTGPVSLLHDVDSKPEGQK